MVINGGGPHASRMTEHNCICPGFLAMHENPARVQRISAFSKSARGTPQYRCLASRIGCSSDAPSKIFQNRCWHADDVGRIVHYAHSVQCPESVPYVSSFPSFFSAGQCGAMAMGHPNGDTGFERNLYKVAHEFFSMAMSVHGSKFEARVCPRKRRESIQLSNRRSLVNSGIRSFSLPPHRPRPMCQARSRTRVHRDRVAKYLSARFLFLPFPNCRKQCNTRIGLFDVMYLTS